MKANTNSSLRRWMPGSKFSASAVNEVMHSAERQEQIIQQQFVHKLIYLML